MAESGFFALTASQSALSHEELQATADSLRELADMRLQHSRIKQKAYYDQQVLQIQHFQPMDFCKLAFAEREIKLATRWRGIYQVLQVPDNLHVILQQLSFNRGVQTLEEPVRVHVNRLRRLWITLPQAWDLVRAGTQRGIIKEIVSHQIVDMHHISLAIIWENNPVMERVNVSSFCTATGLVNPVVEAYLVEHGLPITQAGHLSRSRLPKPTSPDPSGGGGL